MKILSLKIKSPIGKVIRNIDFNEVGVNLVFGDIKEPENSGGTINSLGKTLLLKCIDYVFGANEDPAVIKEAIHGYVIEAILLYNNKKYVVRRILGNSDSIFIGNKPYPLTEFKEFFYIKRNIYGKQFILRKKSSEISYNSKPSKDDVTCCLKLLHLDRMMDSVEEIYKSQDKIKEYKTNKEDLVSFYGNIDVKQIDEEIYFIDKEVQRLTRELEDISKRIKNIEISDIQKNIVEEYAEKSRELKKTKSEYEKNRLEFERLTEFIKRSNKIDISSEHILTIFQKASIEVPEMVKKNIQEVEEFHKKVYEERKEFLSRKKDNIQNVMLQLEQKINVLASEIDRIGKIISMNEVYQESIALYEKYNIELQELKFKEGKLSQIKNIDEKINEEDNNLTINFNNLSQIRKEYDKLIQNYRDFIYNITKSIYDDDVNSYFDIKVRQKHLTTRPIVFEISLKGDTGEGVNEVKKNLIDFLICRYNTYLEMMIQDSACFNGIDPRQVAGMILELSKIAEDTKKQIIVSINKYQFGEYLDDIFIKEKSIITLSENDKLFRFDF